MLRFVNVILAERKLSVYRSIPWGDTKQTNSTGFPSMGSKSQLFPYSNLVHFCRLLNLSKFQFSHQENMVNVRNHSAMMPEVFSC